MKVAGPILAGLLALAFLAVGLFSTAAPVSITLPFSSIPVIDKELDGDPATGSWSDATAASQRFCLPWPS